MAVQYFETKVKFLRQMDNGLIKSVTELYLVDSMSFTETEKRTIEEVGDGQREITMMTVTRSTIKEVAEYGDSGEYWKSKIVYILADDESEKEKKITTYLLTEACDLNEACERTHEHLKEMLVPYEITKIEKSAILEIYAHKKPAPDGFVPLEKTI